jgi:hypothetical protein
VGSANISNIETGSTRGIAIELIQLRDALGFDPKAALGRIAKVRD